MARINSFELRAMNNPLRRLVQRQIELPAFERALARLSIDLRGARVLDVGCGSGYSTELLARHLAPSRLCAFDLMPEQVEMAMARRVPGAEIRVADVTELPYDDGSFDVAFVFGILHHVPEWRGALREIARVLAPGGVLCVEELHGGYVRHQDRFFFTSHPPEAAFDWPSFRAGLADARLAIAREYALVPGVARGFIARRAPAA